MRTVRLIAFALLLSLTLTGCGAGLGLIVQEVSAVASEAAGWIAAIEQAANAVFALHPDAERQAKVDTALQDTRAAADALDKAAQDFKAGTITLDELRAVFDKFKSSYQALLAVGSDFVHARKAGERLGAASKGGVLLVPPPEHFEPVGLRQ